MLIPGPVNVSSCLLAVTFVFRVRIQIYLKIILLVVSKKPGLVVDPACMICIVQDTDHLSVGMYLFYFCDLICVRETVKHLNIRCMILNVQLVLELNPRPPHSLLFQVN